MNWIDKAHQEDEQRDYRRKLVRELRTLPGLTDEGWRLLLRLTDPWEWAEWTEARGLKGLKFTGGGLTHWDLGYRLVCHMKGRLDFYAVEAQGPAIVTALGLKRGMSTVPDETDLTPQQIAECMVAVHRKRRGSVLMILPGDRSDRVELWFGMSEQLAPVARAQDNMRALHAAAEAERKAERQAAKEAVQATPEELAHARAHQAALLAEFTRPQNTAGSAAGRPSPASGGRGRGSVCDDVRAVLTEVPDGLTAAEVAAKTDRALSKVYACLNAGLDDGSYVKIRKLYTLAPMIEEQS